MYAADVGDIRKVLSTQRDGVCEMREMELKEIVPSPIHTHYIEGTEKERSERLGFIAAFKRSVLRCTRKKKDYVFLIYI